MTLELSVSRAGVPCAVVCIDHEQACENDAPRPHHHTHRAAGRPCRSYGAW